MPLQVGDVAERLLCPGERVENGGVNDPDAISMAKMEVVAPHHPQIAPSNSPSCRFSISIESSEDLNSSNQTHLQQSTVKSSAGVHSSIKEDVKTEKENAEAEEQEQDNTIVTSKGMHSTLSENSCETSVIKSEIPSAKDLKQMDFLLKGLPTLGQIFELHHKIGEGTFSSVFLATLRGVPANIMYANKPFAIKHLIPTTHPSRAERELKCLQEIGGKDNVVGVHLCLRNEDFIAFVMPYLPHRRFSEYVLDMDVEETRLYMKNLLLALCRVHSFNIIHRDVKPSNFLYNRETKQFLLVDFGLSQPLEETAPSKVASRDSAITSKKRKREEPEVNNSSGKNDNPNVAQSKFSLQTGMTENVAKRRALQPCNNNSLNIMKTPEKEAKYQLDSKVIPPVVLSRTRNLQNITNLTKTNNALKAPLNPRNLLNSPTKEGVDATSTKKTPRKNRNFTGENFKSPAKNIDKNSLCSADIWRNENSRAKFALGLSKIKAETDARRNGMKDPPQRKILFDDFPDPVPSASRLATESRSTVTMKRPLQGENSFAERSAEPPRLVPEVISSVRSPTGPPPILEKMVDCTNNWNGREFRTLVADATKSPSPGSSIIRVQNSQVKSQQKSPVTPSESRRLLLQGARERDQQKIVFAKPHAPLPTPTTSHCPCFGKPQVCTSCLSRKAQGAPRAGTPGFRPPEVLLRCPVQTTAVDMWAAGVILLCILSGCYPFFRSPDDLTALAEIMSVFGTDNLKEIAKLLGRFVVCSQPSKGLDLKKLCVRMRQRRKERSQPEEGDRCSNCGQIIYAESGCLCRLDDANPLNAKAADLNNDSTDGTFPDTAYHLLARLLDLNPETRITAAEALTHPFVNIKQ